MTIVEPEKGDKDGLYRCFWCMRKTWYPILYKLTNEWHCEECYIKVHGYPTYPR